MVPNSAETQALLVKPNSPHTPPQYLLNLFRWFCKPEYYSDIEGDLLELFAKRTRTHSLRKAKWRMLFDVLLLFRPGIVRPLLSYNHLFIHPAMFKHNLLITYRGFLRHKSTFLINLIGLSTGLACVLLIYLWVQDELSVDSFHNKYDELYQVLCNQDLPEGIQTWDNTPSLLATALEKELPEVKGAVSVILRGGILSVGEQYVPITRWFTSENFFDIMNYQLIHGDSERVLKNPYHIALSQSLALKLFQSPQEAIGKTIQFDNDQFEEPFLISAVFVDPPANATDQFDAVINNALLIDNDPDTQNWSDGYARTFLVLADNTDIKLFNHKIANYLHAKSIWWDSSELFVQKYSESYLFSQYKEGKLIGGRITYVRLFSLIGVIILIIACINCMNLSTAQASRKTKEIGIKKAIGVHRKSLISQFIWESLLLVLICSIFSLVLVKFLLPQFNEITGKTLQLSFSLYTLLTTLGICLGTGLIAGSYPAFYLSGFNPVAMLKGKLPSSNGELWLRKGLVVFQFSLTVIFIVGILVISKQLEYAQTKNLGYNRDNILTFYMGETNVNPDVFISKVKDISGVVHAATFVSSITNSMSGQKGYNWRGNTSDEDFLFQAPMIGYDAIETLGMEIVAGRSFSREHLDDRSCIILNQTALEMMQLENPIGKIIDKDVGQGREKRKIIGVVKDFHYGSIHEQVKPLILRLRSGGFGVLVKLQAGIEQATIEQLERLYREFFPKYTFDFSFMEDEYQALYEAETRVAVLSKYASSLAIIISCLGLFGLATFTAERRQKEMGIRKVLGASVSQLVQLLSADFMKMVLISILIGLPIGYLITQRWLESFAYRIELQWWYFAGAAGITLLIAWLTVSIQTLKAATVNPVESLKDE